MRDTDYKLFNRMMSAAVLLSGIFYMPILRRKLIVDIEGAYDWVDSPLNDSTVRILEIFDSLRLFSAVLTFAIVALIIFLRRKTGIKTAFLLMAGAGVYLLGCGIFALVSGADAMLFPYICEQMICSAALGVVVFIFPQK